MIIKVGGGLEPLGPIGVYAYVYFPPGLQLPPQLLRGLLPIGEQRHNGRGQLA